jgi:hypothetical protein
MTHTTGERLCNHRGRCQEFSEGFGECPVCRAATDLARAEIENKRLREAVETLRPRFPTGGPTVPMIDSILADAALAKEGDGDEQEG